MTSASPLHKDGPAKTLPADQAARLLALPGAVDLAPDATGAADFLDTAKIIAGADLVVSVDTASAHLAAAMGTPTLLLLPHVACWRWFTDPKRSPWYDSVELFRQPSAGDWGSVIDDVVRRVSQAEPGDPATAGPS
jgi:ADP-heptose:LPS heptosyltransferase